MWQVGGAGRRGYCCIQVVHWLLWVGAEGVCLLCVRRSVASLGRIAELNPYVTVRVSVERLDLDSDLSFLKEFQVSHTRHAEPMTPSHTQSLPHMVTVNCYGMQGVPWILSHTHACMHTHIHARMHTHIHACMHTSSSFQCVVLTEASRSLQVKVDKFCRSQVPPIRVSPLERYSFDLHSPSGLQMEDACPQPVTALGTSHCATDAAVSQHEGTAWFTCDTANFKCFSSLQLPSSLMKGFKSFRHFVAEMSEICETSWLV